MTSRDIPPISIHKKVVTSPSKSINLPYFQFIFICSGKGRLLLHQEITPYHQGNLFIVKPNESFTFEIESTTEIYWVRFPEETKLILKELVENSGGRAKALAKAQSPLNSKIQLTTKDEKIVIQLLALLTDLCEDYQNENICYYQLLALVEIIERNVDASIQVSPITAPQKSISLILKHIRKHIFDTNLLSLDAISQQFNFTKNHLGSYFKQETGQSVKQYISYYRMELIAKKIRESELSLSEIAFQFGYVDESHFYKSFKKHYATSPSEYRKQYKNKKS